MAAKITRNNHVLILDGEQFSSLSIVRSLGRKGLNITAAASDAEAICRYSIYTQNFFIYPDPLIDVEGFYQSIKNHLSKVAYDLLIPVTELTSLPLSINREKIEQKTTLALPDNDTLEWVTDKSKTFTLAEKVGVPIPRSYTILDQQTLDHCIKVLSFPVVIKPARSIANPEDDIRAKLNVDYAFDTDELQIKVQRILKNSEVILQEYFTGIGTGIELIADQGTIIHAFQHQRLHELPLTGGGSCLRKSVPVNPQLLGYSQALIKALNWHGVAMVEFKHNEASNQSCLMEINGRFWGSLPLAVSSGSDFPWYLYQLLIEHQHPGQFNSSAGHISRKIKDDLYWYIQVVFRRDNNPLIEWPTNRQLLKDLISIFYYKHHFDAFYYKDIKPGVVELRRTASWLYAFSSNFIQKRILYKKHLKIKQTNGLEQPLKQTNNLLFLCYGNINRSAAAECVFLQQNNKKNYTIQSAGFHPLDKRPADPNMVAIAKEYQCNMQNWSSHSLNQQMIESADLILVMEIEHILKLSARYPQSRSKVYLLGSIDSNTKTALEINDPYGKSLQEYRDCFTQITNCVNLINSMPD